MAVACLIVAALGGPTFGGFSDRLVGKERPPSVSSPSEETVTNVSPGKGATPSATKEPDPTIPREPEAGVHRSQFAPGVFDVVGLKLGMTQEEAVKIVQSRRRELNGKSITFEILKEGKHDVLVDGDVPRTRFVALSDAKSVLSAFDLSEDVAKNPLSAKDPKLQHFAANGQIEVFAFQFPNIPNEPRVSVITRVQRLAPSVHPDTIKGALIQKYGPPTIDDRIVLIWLTDQEGRLMPPSSREIARCRGVVLPPGSPVEQSDYSMFAMKGCGDQLAVQLQGTPDAVVLIQTTLIHHQQLVDQREATKSAALSRFGLSPAQSKRAPAPQF